MSTKDAEAQDSTALQATPAFCPSCDERILNIFAGEITGRRASPCDCALTREATARIDAQLSGEPADNAVFKNGELVLYDDDAPETYLASDTTCRAIVGRDTR